MRKRVRVNNQTSLKVQNTCKRLRRLFFIAHNDMGDEWRNTPEWFSGTFS